ncbi:hypothetical protein SAMN02910358_01622 [Lachnospiraceae bacterium XBB1006]|nr:hypothetical protein SAMN02910358_01622 [Lachnospiraceae bacterium XBB1006]
MLRRKKKHRDRAKFSGRKQSIRGCVGFGIVIIALIALLVSVNFAFVKGGNAGLFLGDLGVLSMLIALVGVIVEILSLTEEDIYKLIPSVGTALGCLTLLSWVGIYVMGALL